MDSEPQPWGRKVRCWTKRTRRARAAQTGTPLPVQLSHSSQDNLFKQTTQLQRRPAITCCRFSCQCDGLAVFFPLPLASWINQRSLRSSCSFLSLRSCPPCQNTEPITHRVTEALALRSAPSPLRHRPPPWSGPQALTCWLNHPFH